MVVLSSWVNSICAFLRHFTFMTKELLQFKWQWIQRKGSRRFFSPCLNHIISVTSTVHLELTFISFHPSQVGSSVQRLLQPLQVLGYWRNRSNKSLWWKEGAIKSSWQALKMLLKLIQRGRASEWRLYDSWQFEKMCQATNRNFAL